jgi:hypothetical protein
VQAVRWPFSFSVVALVGGFSESKLYRNPGLALLSGCQDAQVCWVPPSARNVG